MSNKRKKYNPEFKAKVAAGGPEELGVHPTIITAWKRALLLIKLNCVQNL